MESTQAEYLIQSGDFVAFDVNESGFISIPSIQEPIPDYNTAVSHLRVRVPTRNITCTELAKIDFSRCIFKISGNMDSPITFGSIVKLTHFPTDLYIIATDMIEKTNGKLFCVHLKAAINLAIEHQHTHEWIITSKYKLRDDGDPVRSNDIIIIKSLSNQDIYIDLFGNPDDNNLEKFVGLSYAANTSDAPRIRIVRISDGSLASGKRLSKSHITRDANGSGTLCGSNVFHFFDHIRLLHVESNGHLISRLNDKYTDKYSTKHLGSIYSSISHMKENCLGVFSRLIRSNDCKSFGLTSHKRSTSNGVWRILPLQPLLTISNTGKLMNGDHVCIQHVMSGQYLCMMPITNEASSFRSTMQHGWRPFSCNKSAEYAYSHTCEDSNARSSSSMHAVVISKIVGSGLKVSNGSKIYVKLCNQRGEVSSTTETKMSAETVNWSCDSIGHEIAIDNVSSAATLLLCIKILHKRHLLQDEVILNGIGEISMNLITSTSSDSKMRVVLSDLRGLDGGTLVLFLKPLLFLPVQELRSKSSVCRVMYDDVPDNSEWIVATSSLADQNTIFTLTRRDAKEVPYLEYNENLLIHHRVSKALLSVESLKNTRKTSDSNTWWEYSSDKIVLPIFGSTAEDANIFRMENVSKQEMQDVYYVSRFIPLFRTAVTSFQLTPEPSELLLPLFKYFCLSLSTLCEWTLGRLQTDGGLGVQVDYPTDSSPVTANLDRYPLQCSAGGNDPVLSQSSINDSIAQDLPTSLGPSGAVVEKSDPIVKRQEMLNDANLLVILLHFIDTVHKSSCSKKSTVLTISIPIISHSLGAAYRLLQVIVHNNPRLAFKVISLNGVLLSMVAQLILGWNPPIESILSNICGSTFNVQELDALQRAVPSQDVNLILEQMQYLNLHGYYTAAEKILDLVILLCSPMLSANTSNSVRNTVLRSIFSADQFRLVEESSCVVTQQRLAILNEKDGVNDFCLLFQTFFRDGRWSFRFNSKSAVDPAKETQLPRCEEEEALHSIFDFYRRQCTDSGVDGSVGGDLECILDDNGSLYVLESLGLSGKILYDELAILKGANFSSFVHWWDTRYSPIFGRKSLSPSERLYGALCESFFSNDNAKECESLDRQSYSHISHDSMREQQGFRYSGYHHPDKHITPQTSLDSVGKLCRHEQPRLEKGESTTVCKDDLDWMPASEALAHDCRWRNWFQKSLLLLEILCRDRNLFAQLLTSCMLPPDCIVEVLEENSLEYIDKNIWIDLLVSMYVDHDFVYPTLLAPCAPASPMICGYKENAYSADENSDGQLFNEFSVFNPIYSSKSDYHKRLFRWIGSELHLLDLASQSSTYIQYASSVLKAFTSLLRIGFFEEKEFGFHVESNHTAVAVGCSSISDRGAVSAELMMPPSNNGGNGLFVPTLKGVEELLVVKLEHSATRHTTIFETSRSGRRVSLDALVAKFHKLDNVCANRSTMALSSHVLALLGDLLLLKQIVNIREAFDAVFTTVLNQFENCSLTSPQEYPCGSEYLRRVFSNSLSNDCEAVNAVLTLTTMDDVCLAEGCYEYIANRIDFQDSAAHLMQSFSFMPSMTHSKTPERSQIFILEKLQFCFDAILKELCAISAGIELPLSLSSSSSSAASSSTSPIRRSADSVAYGNDVWVLQSSSSTTNTATEVRRSHDECLTVELNYSHDFSNHEEELASLRAYYDGHSDLEESVRSGPRPRFYDIDLALSSFCRQLISSLRASIRTSLDGNNEPWERCCDNERLVVTVLFSFLSAVASRCALWLSDWVADLAPILVQYFPHSTGAVLLVKSLLTHLKDEKQLNEIQRFASTVFDKLDDFMSTQSKTLPLSMVLAGMHSCTPAVRTTAADFFCKSFEAYLCEFSSLSVLPLLCYGHNSKVLHTNPVVVYLLEVLEAIVCSRRRYLTAEHVQSIREVFTLDICRSCMTGRKCPLVVKRVVTAMSFCIYRDAELQCDDSVEDELNTMRRYFSIEDAVALTPNINQCATYISKSVLDILCSRICGSGMVVEAAIHRAVLDDIHHQAEFIFGGKLPTTMIARLDDDFYTDSIESHTYSRICQSLENTSVAVADKVTYPAIDNFLTACDAMKSHSWALYRALSRRDRNKVLWLCTSLRILLGDESLRNQIIQKVGACVFDNHHRAIRKIDAVFTGIMQIEFHWLFGSSFICKVSSTMLLQQCEADTSTCSTQKIHTNGLSMHTMPANIDLDKDFLRNILTVQLLCDHPLLKGTGVYGSFQEKLLKSMDFIARKGMRLHERTDSSELNSREYVAQFDSYSDLEMWCKGGGIYFEKLFAYLSQVSDPREQDYRMVEVICSMLHSDMSVSGDNGLAKGNRTASINRKQLLKREAARIHEIQFALCKFGGVRFIISVLGRAVEQRESSAYFLDFVPLVLKFGTLLLGWENRLLQDIFIDTFDDCLREKKVPECNCFLGLQKIARKCAVDLDSGVGVPVKAVQEIRVLRAISVLFDFVGSISRGANSKAQEYLSGKNWSSSSGSRSQDVKIVDDLCVVARSTNTAMTKCVQFISSASFTEVLCPLIWAPMGSERRRFVAWHSPSSDVVRIAAFAYLIMQINRSLMSLCSRHCDASIPIALYNAMPVLEIVSLLSLEALSSVFDSNAVACISLHPSERPIQWHGGEPFLFYDTYVKEMTRLQIFHKDPDQEAILAARYHWGSLQHTTGFQLPRIAAKKTGDSSSHRTAFQRAFRVHKEFIRRLAKRTEESILSLVLCYFEVSEQRNLTVCVANSFNFAMVLQNTDNAFKKRACAYSSYIHEYDHDEVDDDSIVKRVVQYITLLDALKELHPRYSSYLSAWYHERATSADKDDPRMLFGSIEILDVQNRLRRVFFPVPKFVLTYWSYPEVRLARDALLQNVSRSSPEEKIRSFLVEMNGLIAVMRRQEALNALLTPLVHSFLGGKVHFFSRQAMWYLPSLRALTLFIAFAFNIYQISLVSLSKSAYSSSRNLAEYLEQSSTSRMQILRLFAMVEFLLYGLLTCRRLVNSIAGDEVIQSFQPDARRSGSRLGARLARVLCTAPTIVALCLADAKWLLFLSTCAFFAWRWENYWVYAPCLLDVVFQIKQMYFLYVAITKNIVKIGYTMLLTFLLLYFAAFVAYFYVSDPYSFVGAYSKCSAADNDTILSCYLTHLDYGLNSAPLWPGDGFIRPVIPDEYTFPYSDVVSVVAGSVFQLLYVIVINLVLQAIISGLIIDTFFEMRAAADAIFLDTRDKCFICSITKENFDIAGLDFLAHIKEEHNIWHYVWYRIYLDIKDSTEFTINEKFALACYCDTRMFAKFMPIKRSISLESTYPKTV